MTSKARDWFEDGLRFQCTQCGNCCTGPPGAVWFTPEEGRAMAAELKISEETFLAEYARPLSDGMSLIERETKHGFDCIFLDRTTVPGKAICSLYVSRPHQCRTWPFWSENLRSKAVWEKMKEITPCPGMNVGGFVSADEVRIIRDSMS